MIVLIYLWVQRHNNITTGIIGHLATLGICVGGGTHPVLCQTMLTRLLETPMMMPWVVFLKSGDDDNQKIC